MNTVKPTNIPKESFKEIHDILRAVKDEHKEMLRGLEYLVTTERLECNSDWDKKIAEVAYNLGVAEGSIQTIRKIRDILISREYLEPMEYHLEPIGIHRILINLFTWLCKLPLQMYPWKKPITLYPKGFKLDTFRPKRSN